MINKHNFKIKLGLTGRGDASFELDGLKLTGITDISINANVDNVTNVTLTMPCESLIEASGMLICQSEPCSITDESIISEYFDRSVQRLIESFDLTTSDISKWDHKEKSTFVVNLSKIILQELNSQ